MKIDAGEMAKNGYAVVDDLIDLQEIEALSVRLGLQYQ